MLTLINSNRSTPPVAPIALDYLSAFATRAGIRVELLDLGLEPDPDAALRRYFAANSPRLVGISFRNVDDCFWPSGKSFVPELVALVRRVKELCAAQIVLGGVGFSLFAGELVRMTGAEFGIRSDGEQALVALYRTLERGGDPRRIPGLVWWDPGGLHQNRPASLDPIEVPGTRDIVDNHAYFVRGGQAGVETKRGCPRACAYCADPLAKGRRVRVRSPRAVADEFQNLLAQGITAVHLCDGEFNLPRSHALAVCEELARRRLGDRIGWYCYAAVTPFDRELGRAMRRAGCLGIDFTGDSGSEAMLRRYGHKHRRPDLARAVAVCREQNIACMVDLLLGGPGETPETVRETIEFVRQLEPDCVGAALGVRLYPGTPLTEELLRQGPLEQNPSIRRHYQGRVDLLQPTFYLSEALGTRAGALVRDLIADDPRFFPPSDEPGGGHAGQDHNYHAHTELAQAIADGARGAYWHILQASRGAAN